MKNNLQISKHQISRIQERFEIFTNADITFGFKNHVKHNLRLLEKVKLPSNKSFGILLGTFVPVETSKHYVTVTKDRSYYSIIDDTVISDSTGDQFWIVVRNNKITTFMLRKSIQTADLAHNLEKMRVEEVILDLKSFIKEQN